MQSDTVIGIVGAVVLVSVMVGVFAYEYNNADAPDEGPMEPTESEKRDTFNETFLGLDPDGDLDGDGVPNWNETDLDNDGINNTEDDVFEYMQTFDAGGAVTAAPNSNGYSLTFEAEEGVTHVMLSLSHAQRAAGNQNLAPLEVSLSHTGGNPTASPTVAGGTVTYVIDVQDAGPGTYTLTVNPFTVAGTVSADPGTAVTGSIEFHYEL